MNTIAAELIPARANQRVALTAVGVRARLNGLLAETAVSQTYRNLEQEDIEAVYTFPLPRGAVLLELALTLNGNTLAGQVLAAPEAEEDYEEAITDGDTAVLLSNPSPGLYSINVGNLKPNEHAEIRFRYAQLLHWQSDSLRLQLPTTVAPRYGNPAAAGLAAHQAPEHTLDTPCTFDLLVEIEGDLAQADFECPTHPVRVNEGDGLRCLRIDGQDTAMDRDFVLVLRAGSETAGQALAARDASDEENGYVALASFRPEIAPAREPVARCIKLVVDCSGSMAGDSIDQARRALTDILGKLNKQDAFNIVVFGSTHRTLFAEPQPARGNALRHARRFVDELDADLGGTEIGDALRAACANGPRNELPADVLLVTDGQVWDSEAAIAGVRESGHRIFTVGVGSAVSEVFVNKLADVTGGACELVTPGEDIAERIVRHFERLHQPRAVECHIDWPGKPVRQHPEPIGTVFAGDTLHAFAWFAEAPVGHAELVLTLEDGGNQRHRLTFAGNETNEQDTLARIAAHARLEGLDSKAATDLAVTYQLVTAHTSCVLVHERAVDEKAEGLPALRKVPYTLAAGWGGTGRFAQYLGGASVAFCSSMAPARVTESAVDYMYTPPPYEPSGIDRFVANLNARYPGDRASRLDMAAIDELEALGLPAEIVAGLRRLAGEGTPEKDLAIGFLSLLIAADAGENVSRNIRRLIRRAARDTAPLEPVTREAIVACLEAVDEV